MTGGADLRRAWADAIPFDEYLATVGANRLLWDGVYRTARIPQWAIEGARERGPGIRLLVLVEDWCGDAANSVPPLARLGHQADCLEMRVLRRDEHLEVMDHFLTNGSRSIPIVVAIDRSYRELGHWGPRPAELQQWVMAHKDSMPSEQRYKEVRRWYAKDRGATTLREVLALL